jgi:hypothetical protein
VRAVSADDPEHGARRAMTWITGSAKFAVSASDVYLPNHAPANLCCIRALFDDADKLVSDRSVEAGVTTRDLEIGIANPGEQHAHKRLLLVIGFIDLLE